MVRKLLIITMLIAAAAFCQGQRASKAIEISGDNGGKGQVFNVKAYGATGNGSTDDSSAVQAAINAATAAGGGTVYFPSGTYRLGTALTFPNDGATPVSSMNPLRLIGASSHNNNQDRTGGSILDITETSDTYGGIDLRAYGYVEIAHLMFEDTAQETIPFINVTNTEVHIHDNGFWGQTCCASAVQTAINLGGMSTSKSMNGDAIFQGYGTTIRENWFNRIKHAVYEQNGANGIPVQNNLIETDCGGDAPFIVNSGTGNYNTGGTFSGNVIEFTYYQYGFIDTTGVGFNFLANHVYDNGTNSVADIYLGSATDRTVITCGRAGNTQDACIDTSSPGYAKHNTILGGTASPVNQVAQTLAINSSSSSLSGTTAGTLSYSVPFDGNRNTGSRFGAVMLYFQGYENTTGKAQTVTYSPQPFYETPVQLGSCPSGMSSTATTLKLPTSMGSAFTGTCMLVGW